MTELKYNITCLVNLLIREYMSQWDIIKRNEIRTIIKFYDNIGIAIVNDNKKRISEYIFDDSIEVKVLKDCFHFSDHKKEALIHYIKVIKGLKEFLF